MYKRQVEGKAEFKPWGPFTDIEIFDWEGFVPDMNDADYVAQLKARICLLYTSRCV